MIYTKYILKKICRPQYLQYQYWLTIITKDFTLSYCWERGGGWDFFFLHFFTPLDKSWHLRSRVYPVIESSEVWHTYGTWGNFYPKSITVRSKLPGREKRPESRLSGSCPPCCLGACSSLFCFGKMEGLAGKSQNYIGAGWNRSQRPRKQHPRWCTFDSSFRFRERSFGGE